MLYVVLMLIATAVPVFATGAGEVEEPDREALIVGLLAEPTTLDPHAGPAPGDLHILVNLYEGLVRFQDDSFSVEPALAQSWEVSADGLRYTFYLRKGVTFHDGTPFNAAAVQFNVERMINGNHRLFGTGPLAMPFSDSGLTDARVLDENTVQLSLSAPFAPFLPQLASPAGLIVSPAAVRQSGRGFGQNPVGTGAYRFVGWDGKAQVTLTAFEDYRETGAGAGAGPENITFRPFTDQETRVTTMLSGEVDLIVDVPADRIQVFRQRAAFRVYEQAGVHAEFLILDMRNGPFSDHAMRQAVNYALNKAELIDGALDGAADVANGPISPVFDWAHNDDLEPYPYDPPRARELIARSGYRGEEIVVAVPNGSWRRRLQEDLTAVGLNVSVILERDDAQLRRASDMMHASWQSIDPELLPFLTLRTDAFPEAGGYNRGYYPNLEVNALLNRAWEESDQRERARVYREVQAIVREDAPWLFVANRRTNMVAVEGLRDVRLHPAGLLDLREAALE
jgi:peptide/nickel transport system substrate-binding protein